MTKYEAMREAIEVRIDEMDEDDIITAWNDNEVGERIYYTDEFDDLFYNYTPQGIAEMASDCGWESWYDYFTYDGEIRQSNCIEDLVDLDDLVEYVLNEEDDLGDEEIRKALDGDVEYDDEDEEDDDVKNEMKCENCAYYWKEEDYDRYPVCHWQACCADDIPPCEEEPYWEEDDEDENEEV